MARLITNYLFFNGVYVLLFTFAKTTSLLDVGYLAAICIGFLGMLIFFLATKKKFNKYHDSSFYFVHLVFAFIFTATTILYDQFFGLMIPQEQADGSTTFSKSPFYQYTLPFNYSIIFGTLLLTIHSIVAQKWKNLAICLAVIALLSIYIYLIFQVKLA